MAGALIWQSEGRCVVGDITFQVLPAGLLHREDRGLSLQGADFVLLKEPPAIDRYAELVEQIRPRRIFELGVFQGGSTALLLELAHPDRLVAIDRAENTMRKLRDYLSSRPDRSAVARVYGDVDQGDRARLAELAAENFGDEPLDLVVDDCSHLYELTRASFNELFPRLRPGGVYAIEDWRWAHGEADFSVGRWPEGVPLSRLALELVLASASAPGLISGVRVGGWTVEVTRGEAEADPRDFEISTYIDAPGRVLLGDSSGS